MFQSGVSLDASNWAASAGTLQERLASGTVHQGPARRIKPEYYCEEFNDTIDAHNAALVAALREARAIKCEVLRHKALRQIRKRKREVPEKPAAMWKIAQTGPGTFALQITMAASEQNHLIDASVLNDLIQNFLSRICPTFAELSISQLQMVPITKPFS